MCSLRIPTIMTLSLQGLNFLCTSLLFLTTQGFCANIMQVKQLTRTLEHTFGHNFENKLDIGDVFIWNISGKHEPFTPLQHNGEDVKFGSNETFLLFTQKSLLLYTVYYWSGGNTSLIDKLIAAKYAVLLSQYSKIIPTHPFIQMNIARETEGKESDSFYHTVKVFNGHDGPRMDQNTFENYLDNHLPSPRPNLYIVWGVRHSRIKKIPFSSGLQWLVKNDICIIPEMEYEEMDMVTINFFCGTEANGKQVERTRSFASWLFCYHNSSVEWYTYQIGTSKCTDDYKDLVEVLEDVRFYNPYEVDNSNDHLKNDTEFVRSRDVEVLLYDVTNDGLKVNSTRPIRSSIFQGENMGYLLDTNSVAGVFFVLPNSENINKRVKAIQVAEKYMDETYAPSSGHIVKMRIIESSINSHIVDFEINLSDYPPIHRDDLPDDELW